MNHQYEVSIDHSHVVLIDCLPRRERSVRLSDDIQDIINASAHRAHTQFINRHANSKKEFIDILENLCLAFESCEKPQGLILQIEAHGADFQSNIINVGLEAGSNREFIVWEEMRPYFSRLYRASAGRLTLNVSACWGYTALAAASKAFADNCAPFRNLVSPSSSLTTRDLNAFWHEFYGAVFSDLDSDLNDCLKRHANFHLTTIESFLETYALNTGRQLSDEEFQIRLQEDGAGAHTIEEIRKRRKTSEVSHVREFLLLDKFPGLADTIDFGRLGPAHADVERIDAASDKIV